MQAPNPAALPIESIPIPLPEVVPGSRFVSTAVDLSDGWGRRRLLAVIASQGASAAVLEVASLTDRIERLFLTKATSSAENTLDSLVTSIPAEISFAIALIEGADAILAARPVAQGLLDQDGERIVFPFAADGTDGVSIFRAELLEGDILALAVADPEQAVADLQLVESAADLDAAIGPTGSAIWFELTLPEYSLGLDEEFEPIVTQSATIVQPAPATWDLVAPSVGGYRAKPLGADALRRYGQSSRSRTPGALHSRMPRGRPPFKVMIGALLAATLLIGFGYWLFANRPNDSIPVTAQVEQQSAALLSAIEADNIDAIDTLIPGAEQTLSLAERSGLTTDEVTTLRFTLLEGKDLVNGADRLGSVEKIGSLPAEFDDRKASLVLLNKDLLVLGETLYRVDPANRELWVWASAASEIDSGTALIASSDGTTVAIASDQVAFFQKAGDTTFSQYYGQWPEGFDPAESFASVFSGRLYLLDPSLGEIWVTDPETAESRRWLLSDQDPLGEDSVGMVVDGGVHVVYKSGELASLYEGSRYVTESISDNFSFEDPTAMTYGPLTKSFYIAGTKNGQPALLKIVAETGAGSIYLLGPDSEGFTESDASAAFAELQSLVVDETTGNVYWAGNGALWQAPLPEEEE